MSVGPFKNYVACGAGVWSVLHEVLRWVDCARHLYPGLVLSNFVSFSLGYFIYYIFFFSIDIWP